ncbi:MAG TPA: TraM recognition domain-containing protein [Gaiellaceae bacterium]|nr:TraM recognition domain-containing protein [Gaiellaceae bacterium]
MIGAADLAGALAELIAGGGFHPIGFGSAATFVGHLLGHPKSPAALWPSEHPSSFTPALFFVLCAILIGAVLALVVVMVRLVRRTRWPNEEDGFASIAAVNQQASLRAARRRAAQTRPSLASAEMKSRSGLDGREVGYPLGMSRRPRNLDLWASWEVSMQLVAPMGSGKTMRVLAHALRQHPGPVLATSTKPDLYEVSVGARSGPIFALDPEDLAPAAERVRWSPVAGCEETRVAERRASALIAANGEASDARAGVFFRQSAVAVLGAYLHAAALSGATMADVVRWAARPSDNAPRRILTRAGDETIDWAARLHEHTSGAPETTSGVTRTVDLALACFRHREVLALSAIAPDEAFDIKAALKANATIYVLGKDRPGVSAGVGPLITAFCDELLLEAERLAARQAGRRLDPPLLALLDEAPNIVPLPSLPALVADGRGRGIVVVYAMQSFSQAIERWGAAGAATLRNATTITAVFGGLSVAQDLRELSELCGTRRVVRHSITSDPRRAHDSFGATWADEPVLTPAEIHGLSEGELLLLWGSLPPILAYQPGVWEGKDAALIAAQERAARDANDAARRAGPSDSDEMTEPSATVP